MAGSDRSGPVAVITGGSQGLGLALAEALADRGWSLVVDARRRDRLDAAVARLAARTAVTGVAGDVTDPAHRAALVDAATRLGDVRALVNNASTLGGSPLPALSVVSADVLRRVYDVNVVAPIALVQAFGDRLRAGAAILNVTSDAAVEAYEGWGAYGSSKAALEHASRVLAIERPDLRVLVVDPGDMRTEMHQDAFPGEDIGDHPLPEVSVPGLVALIEGDQPSGRYEARAVARTPAPVR
ncbi:MAG TPA: SDR family oxidoreductase [Acidimicrobiia bacterium]|nr:SDR family oxidoreductase [Acidimicrobiia bacterium]